MCIRDRGEVVTKGGDRAQHDEHEDGHGDDAPGGGVTHFAAGGVSITGRAGQGGAAGIEGEKRDQEEESRASGEQNCFHGI